MKISIAVITLFLYTFGSRDVFGQITYQMNFESVPDFSLSFSPWLVIDVDGDSTYGITGHNFPHNSAPMAFIAFNPATVVPAMTDAGIQPHNGSRYGASFSSSFGANNDWFISPRIQLKNNGEFSFWAKAYTNAYNPEKYKVGISTTTNDPSAFVFLSGNLPLTADTFWTTKSYNLSAYNNQQVYLAIQCVSNDAFIFMIDDLEVIPGDSIVQLPSSAMLDFENVPDFSLDFSPWTTADVNGGSTYGIDSVTFPGIHSPMAYICFNQTQTTPPLYNMPAYSGRKFGACFSSEPPKNPNNKWLISPELKLEANAKLAFWVQTYNSFYGFEKFTVGVSTTGVNPADFTIISGSAPNSAPDTWTRKVYDLANYVNQPIYVGIQCVTDTGFIFMVDDIEIGSHVSVNEASMQDIFQVFPNPAKDRIFINAGNQLFKGVNIKLIDGIGKVVLEHSYKEFTGILQVNCPDLANGVYCLILQNQEMEVVKKILIQN